MLGHLRRSLRALHRLPASGHAACDPVPFHRTIHRCQRPPRRRALPPACSPATAPSPPARHPRPPGVALPPATSLATAPSRGHPSRCPRSPDRHPLRALPSRRRPSRRSDYRLPRTTMPRKAWMHRSCHMVLCRSGRSPSTASPCALLLIALEQAGRFSSLQIEPISGWCKHATRDFSSSKNVAGGRAYQQKELEPTTPAKDTDIVIKRIQKSTRELEQGPVGKNLSSAEKRKFLVNTLLGLEDSREVVYGTLDAWVAFEQDFPLASLKQALSALEKEQQWHRIVQVIKWMLSKGQGNTIRTYEQLVCALEKDNRAEEAHKIWQKKIAHDLQSVPWRFCHLMLAIYYRNNRLERLVKLFKELEACGRKPPSKDIIRKVEDAYEMLGLLEEKEALLEKYKDLYNKPSRDERRRGSKSKRTELDKTDADRSMQCKMATTENHQDHCCPSDKESAVTA